MLNFAALPILTLVVMASAHAQVAPPAAPVRQRPTFQPVPKGTAAPDFTAFDVNGKALSLHDLKGKVVIVDFWASWCGPCQVSMPGLQQIYKQIKSQGVVVLSLNTWDKKEDFVKWVGENSGTKYDFTFVRDPAEGDHDQIRKDSIAKRLYNVIGIPTMYVIGKDGKVIGATIGSGNEAALVKILDGVGIKATIPQKGGR